MNNNLSKRDPIEQILDENNTETVVLFDDAGHPIEFEQVAVIPLDETDKLYAIMIPITPMENVSEGEGVCFVIDEEERNIQIERDEDIIDKVLEVYERLLGADDDDGKDSE